MKDIMKRAEHAVPFSTHGPFASWACWPSADWDAPVRYFATLKTTDGVGSFVEHVWRCTHTHKSRGDATACAQAELDRQKA
jgi:hypothetical protein